MFDIEQIRLSDIESALREEVDEPFSEWTGWVYFLERTDVSADGAYRMHIVHHAEALRGGIILVGPESSGVTSWTDAATPGEVLDRYLDDDMRN